MGTYDTYSTDKDLEENGAWFTLSDGSEWKLRRANSKASRTELRKAEAPFRLLVQRSQEKNQDLPDKVADQINAGWLSRGIVVDFRGVTGPDGEPLTYSQATVEQLVSDLPELALEIIRLAASQSQYQNAVAKAAEKNSQNGSSGS